MCLLFLFLKDFGVIAADGLKKKHIYNVIQVTHQLITGLARCAECCQFKHFKAPFSRLVDLKPMGRALANAGTLVKPRQFQLS